MEQEIQVASFLPRSKANGPGKRATLWLQGCGKRCERCCNPEFQSLRGGKPVPVSEVAGWIADAVEEHDIRGLSLSGGDPLYDRNQTPVKDLLNWVRRHLEIDILMFTGYTVREMFRRTDVSHIVDLCDLVIAGPYDHTRPLERGLASSENQTIVRMHPNAFPDVSWVELYDGDRIIEFIIEGDRTIISGLMGREEALALVDGTDVGGILLPSGAQQPQS